MGLESFDKCPHFRTDGLIIFHFGDTYSQTVLPFLRIWMVEFIVVNVFCYEGDVASYVGCIGWCYIGRECSGIVGDKIIKTTTYICNVEPHWRDR